MLKEEWKAIYEKYYKSLYLYALTLTKSKHDAEDLLQETFVKAYLSYKQTGSIKYWLVTVLRNQYYNNLRKQKRVLLDEGKNLIENFESIHNTLDEIISKEDHLTLFKEIQKLPRKMKEVLMESVYFEMTDLEIAKSHNITTVNVRKIRSRAKGKLIEIMREDKT